MGKTSAFLSEPSRPNYFVPESSAWPLVGSVALTLMGLGAASWVNNMSAAPVLMTAAVVVLLCMLWGWFGTVIRESERGLYSESVDRSFRWSMGWFIFSEVMLFAVLFGALFYARQITLPLLSDIDHQAFLWPYFRGIWPNNGPGDIVESFQTMAPWPLPTINTALLLTSGMTITMAHHAIKDGRRGPLGRWLLLTILLGVVFLFLQASEYIHAYESLNLKLSSGIFGATFFFLTGLHGLHVLIGALMLSVILARIWRGHFSSEHHFAFEAAAWYWHFVDVVWLGLYVVVYCL